MEDKEKQDTTDSLVSEIKMYTQQTHTIQTVFRMELLVGDLLRYTNYT